MAQVPLTVATVKPNSSSAAGSLTGNKSVPKNNVKDNKKGRSRSFTDAMNKVNNKNLSDSRKRLKDLPSENSNKKNLLRTVDLKKMNTGPRDDSAGIAESGRLQESEISIGKLENQGIQESVISKTEQSLENPELSSPLIRSLSTENVSGQTIHPQKVHSVLSRKRQSGNRPVKTAMKKILSSSGNLTSSSRWIEVLDNRKHALNPETKLNNSERTAHRSQRPDSPGSYRHTSDPVRLEHNPVVAETDIEITPRLDSKSSQRSAASELAHKLDGQAGNDIVRQVKVILNRSDSGEVQINLRPDNLGKVRVRISMENNRLTGRIFVETAAAREAFRTALDGLQTKLVESGFGAADLELEWDDSPRGFNQNSNQSGNKQGRRNDALREFENITPTTASGEAAIGRLNMVV